MSSIARAVVMGLLCALAFPSATLAQLPDKEAVQPVKPAGDMVAVPAGTFFMGCNEQVDRECFGDEKPGRQVQVGAFRIDSTEVTVAHYGACVATGDCSAPGMGGSCNWGVAGRENHPINCVDWSQADSFCHWAGKRLPTEAEWEKAVRGTDGRVYPWGNAFDATRSNVDRRGTMPVGSFPEGASPYGALDMAGNVWEWTAAWDLPGEARSVRGGSWGDGPRFARTSLRSRLGPSLRYGSVGFRCAQ